MRPYRDRSQPPTGPLALHATAVVHISESSRTFFRRKNASSAMDRAVPSPLSALAGSVGLNLSKILQNYGRVIITSNTGGGHDSVVRAFELANNRLDPNDYALGVHVHPNIRPDLEDHQTGPIDAFILADGIDGGFHCDPTEDSLRTVFDADDIMKLPDSPRYRAAFSLGSWGASLPWVKTGFKVSAGPVGVNFYPLRWHPFIEAWVSGGFFGGSATVRSVALESICLSEIVADAFLTRGDRWETRMPSNDPSAVLSRTAAATDYFQQRWGIDITGYPTGKSLVDAQSEVVVTGASTTEIDSEADGRRSPGPSTHSKRARTNEGVRR